MHAFKYKLKRNGVDVKEEVGAWDRAGLEVSTERLQTTTRVSLQWLALVLVALGAVAKGTSPTR